MFRFLKNLFGGELKSQRRNPARSKFGQQRVLGMEGLERRELMAVAVGFENGDLVITGTDSPDHAEVSYENGKYVVND